LQPVQRMGYECSAESGMVALAVLEQQTPDLMITDLAMPK
jgi:YesN/AraC family two-component response regulator